MNKSNTNKQLEAPQLSSRLLKKSMKAGCSKMLRCKACEIMRNEAYFSYAAVKHDERNAADGRFSTAC